MDYIKLKDDVPFHILTRFGFEEDSANCEPGDHYYHLNNYYIQINNEFRITVYMTNRCIDILCLPSDTCVHNIYNIKPLFDLISNGLVEIGKK